MFRILLATLALTAVAPILAPAIAPARAQDSGGLRMHQPLTTLDRIESNRGCPLSNTSVTVGINKSVGNGSSARQQLGTAQGGDPSGCRPLVSTRVVSGFNLALGRGSGAEQTVTSNAPRGVLGTTLYSRGANVGYGALSAASQRLINQTSR